jgi:outer membrane lipoprotein carrier protein
MRSIKMNSSRRHWVDFIHAVMLTIFGLLVTFGSLADAVTSNFDRFIRQLQQHYESTTSFTANFKQSLSSAGGQSRERAGKIYYQKPGRIRWQFDPPQPETIVSDGKTLYDFDPGLNQVTEMPLADAFKGHSAAAFIMGIGNLERDFIAEPLTSARPSDQNDQEEIAIRPKDGGDKIELGVNKKSLNIMTVRIADALGNTNLIHLSDIKCNITLDSALFEFNPPSNADIVVSPSHR